MAPNFELLRERPRFLRFDRVLLTILYPLTVLPSIWLLSQHWVSELPSERSKGTFAFVIDHLDVEGLEPYTMTVVLPFVVMAVHALGFLFSTWSVTFWKRLAFTAAGENDATHVLFTPSEHHGSSEIVKLNKSANPISAIFQQKRREMVDGKFVALKYPVDLKIGEYMSSRGLRAEELKRRIDYFGHNIYDVPVPSFVELLKQHILAPFFVFQVFSISCWMLDEYFTFPLFSLLSLVIMEANTVRTRQSNMLELRGVETEPVQIYVYRDDQWTLIQGSKLVPGDLVLATTEMNCPADLLLLSGRAVTNEAMLTGESTPQVKESIETMEKEHRLDMRLDKAHIVFGGTHIQQLLPADANDMYVPQKGCLAFVLSTGLGSSQGKLIRTMLFASQRVAAESKDAVQLLMFLMIFAFVASGYVIINSMGNPNISTYRLIVEVILIMTSTIPPDLPMELTFAVNASLLALSKLYVFCTEPFRIPFAGTVSVCCFDKTGTITAEEYELLGIDEMKDDVAETTTGGVTGRLEKNADSLGQSLMVTGGCHSLVASTNGRIIGDSLEAAAFSALKFTQTMAGKNKHKRFTLEPVKKFHFSAELRRMSTIVNVVAQGKKYVLTKGAPEVVANFLEHVPDHYKETYRSYTRQGCRVLALACREISGNNAATLTREEAEKELTFCGFAVFGAPFKAGSEDTIVELLKSTHRVIIITGDDPLTACHVASRAHMINKPPLIHDGDSVLDSYDNPPENGTTYALCYTGKALESVSDAEFTYVVRQCNVFARMSPKAKASVLTKLKELGERTLMCGDGTNDVGALKQAHCGVGLVEGPGEQVVNTEDEYKPKLGAASIAAPFVSKRATISGCLDLIRFGRATLSSTTDLFKQLSLNCLVNAFSVSVLFVDNVKFGDQQMTIFALVLSAAFMGVSWAKPMRKLSKERPFESQFNAYIVVSVLLQFSVHLFAFMVIRKMVFAAGYVTKVFDCRVKFEPSLMNTAMFVASAEMQISTFIANYRGHPFMQSFTENKLLLISVIASSFCVMIMLIGENELVRAALELVAFPDDAFKYRLTGICLLDLTMCFVIEKITLFVFSMKNRYSSRDLVEQSIQDDLKSYQPNNDDLLPEESHKFGFIDMIRQNVEIQRKMVLRRHHIALEEKRAQTKKGRKKKTK